MYAARADRFVPPDKRPPGVWLISFHALVFAGVMPLFLKLWMIASGNFNGDDVLLFGASIVVHALVIPTAFGAWSGNNRARLAFVALIGLNYAIDSYVNLSAAGLPGLNDAPAQRFRLIALRSLLWAGLVIWYFLRPKTRAWFAAVDRQMRSPRWRDERGSNVAQAAAVAILAAVLIGVIVVAGRDLTPRVQQAMSCLVGAIGGGGGSCAGAPSTTDASSPPDQPTQQSEDSSEQEQEDEHDGGFWSDVLDGTQIVLDVAGLVPGVGEIADGANALISLGRGNYADAALSAAAMIPFVGWGGTAAKWGKRGVETANAIDNANDARRTADRVDDLTDAGQLGNRLSSVSDELAARAQRPTAGRNPCLGSAAPVLKVRGLAAPLFACPTLVDGMRLGTNDALDAAEAFLGSGYRDLGNGRFMSADGTRVVRMGDSDILGRHGGGPHMNFETLAPNPSKPGKMMVVDNKHIYLDP